MGYYDSFTTLVHYTLYLWKICFVEHFSSGSLSLAGLKLPSLSRTSADSSSMFMSPGSPSDQKLKPRTKETSTKAKFFWRMIYKVKNLSSSFFSVKQKPLTNKEVEYFCSFLLYNRKIKRKDTSCFLVLCSVNTISYLSVNI